MFLNLLLELPYKSFVITTIIFKITQYDTIHINDLTLILSLGCLSFIGMARATGNSKTILMLVC